MKKFLFAILLAAILGGASVSAASAAGPPVVTVTPVEVNFDDFGDAVAPLDIKGPNVTVGFGEGGKDTHLEQSGVLVVIEIWDGGGVIVTKPEAVVAPLD